ncbi:MAG: hypothetical protein ABSH47_13770 [Bryobacteraceae bacterium]
MNRNATLNEPRGERERIDQAIMGLLKEINTKAERGAPRRQREQRAGELISLLQKLQQKRRGSEAH